jgi:hypothetical protein
MKVSQNMEVIFNSINPVQMATLVFNYTSNVSIELIGVILLNSGKTILCSENKVIQYLTLTANVPLKHS